MPTPKQTTTTTRARTNFLKRRAALPMGRYSRMREHRWFRHATHSELSAIVSHPACEPQGAGLLSIGRHADLSPRKGDCRKFNVDFLPRTSTPRREKSGRMGTLAAASTRATRLQQRATVFGDPRPAPWFLVGFRSVHNCVASVSSQPLSGCAADPCKISRFATISLFLCGHCHLGNLCGVRQFRQEVSHFSESPQTT